MSKKSFDFFLDLCRAQELMVTDVIPDIESQKYYAYSFTINGKRALFRCAYATPVKSGFFVTLWKRPSIEIAPYDLVDEIDLVVIAIESNLKLGFFIFPQSFLLQKSFFSVAGVGGKRGFRIYAPWSTGLNASAEQARQWQIKYFALASESSALCALLKVIE